MKIRFLLVAVLLGGAFYLHRRFSRNAVFKDLLPPPAIDMPEPIAMNPQDIEKVRTATKDSDPQVRWAAIDLLYRLKDPQAVKIIEQTLAVDTEPSVRRNAIDILKQHDKNGVGRELLPALRDTEKDIRIAALIALGEYGRPSTVSDVSELLTDSEPEVRIQALRTLSRIQERRVAEFVPLQEQMRQNYEQASSRSLKRKAITSPFIQNNDFKVE